jgi:cysteinyl-tRNA synthetase
MDDDFNTAGAVGAIFEAIRFCRKALDDGDVEKECLEVMRKTVVDMCDVLGLKIEVQRIVDGGQFKTMVEALTAARELARKTKDFKKADEIRRQLSEQGVELEDTPYGTKWKTRA